MDKKYQMDSGEDRGCLGKCVGFIMCCNLPSSAGVKLVSIFSILFGLVYCCLGVWTLIVTTSNNELPMRQQLYYEIAGDPTQESTPPRKVTPLSLHHSYLLALACISLAVGFMRALSSIFLLWNSVEKRSTTPGKFWILLTFIGSATIVSFLMVSLNVTGFMVEFGGANVRVHNDKFSFYILLTIFRFLCFADIFLVMYFIFIVLWFIRTQ